MNVQCSWKVSDGRPISDAVFYNRETEDADLEDEINIENCVFLKAPDNSEGLYPTVPACQLLICCEPPNQITRVSAICEAKVIEIYGHHGEYIKTIFNYPLEETDNLFVYRGDVVLEKPLSVCSVKFVNLQSQNEMWLFGVKIHTDRMTYSPQNQGIPIPFAAIQQKLESMKNSQDKEALKLFTDNLLKFGLSAMNLQQSSTATSLKADDNVPNYMYNHGEGLLSSEKVQDMLLRNFGGMQGDSKEERVKDENSEIEANSQQGNLNRIQTSSASPLMFTSLSTSTQTEEDYSNIEENLKTYLNEQIEAINKRFSEMEAKLLCKLDEIESFVKPHGISSK